MPAFFDLVLFDLDGTLVETKDLEAFRGSSNINNFENSYELNLKSAIGYGRNKYISENTIKKIRKNFPNIKVGVFTTAPKNYANILLRELFQNTTWDIVIGYEDVNKTKPSPDGIFLAMNNFNITRPSKVALIGDSEKDIKSAYNAGAWVGLIKSSWPIKKKTEHFNAMNLLPDAIIDGDFHVLSVLTSPLDYFPVFEQYYYASNRAGIQKKCRFQVVNHFNNHRLNDREEKYVSVITCGRLFPNYSHLEARREWHKITSEISIHKDANVFPNYWMECIFSVIQDVVITNNLAIRFGFTKLIFTVIPHKSGRVPRLESLLVQLEDHYRGKYPNAKIRFIPDVFQYKASARSHHGEHLTAKERFNNVRNNLHVQVLRKSEIANSVVVVLDDVVTCGATMYFADKYLKEVKASKVHCIALTQTVNT